LQVSIKKIAFAIAIIGLITSTYIEVVRLTSIQIACPENSLINCNDVLNSKYSTIFGVPNSLLGIIFFLLEIIVISKYFGKDQMLILNCIGITFVAYYIFTEYLLGRICEYCTIVHASVILLLAISIIKYGKPTS
jgi:uncharacterized membrane protein